MNINLKISFACVCLLQVVFCFAQKQNVKVTKGVEYFNNGDYSDANAYFKSLVNQDSTNADYHFWLARSYEETSFNELALYHYKKSYQFNPKIATNILYLIARAYQENLFFSDAIAHYKMYKKTLEKMTTGDVMDENMKVAKRLNECENGKIIVANPYQHKIYHLSKILNSEYAEYTPSVSADNKKMIFTSRRPNGISEKKDIDNGYFEDVWMSTKNANGEWGEPINLGVPINSEYHDACISMNAAGNEMFLYKSTNGGDLFESDLVNGKWTKPEPLKHLNTKYKEPSVCVSADNKIMYFSSDRPGGHGGLDIYMCIKDKNNEWGHPINMGSQINSDYDEDSPFLSPDSKTLFFSSNGHSSMGGYDIFSVHFDTRKKTWSKPHNMGFPINSAENDIYFNISGDHKTAYYSSAKKDGFGEKDIYMILIDSTYADKPLPTVELGTEAPKHIVAVHPSLLKHHEGHKIVPHPSVAAQHEASLKPAIEIVEYKGTVLDENQNPIESDILVKKENSTEQPKSYHTATNGEFNVPLEKGFQYGVDIQKDGYVFASNHIDLTPNSKTFSTTATSNNTGSGNVVTPKVIIPKIISEKVILKKPKAGDKIELKNVFYKSGSASLTDDSYAEIQVLIQFLKKNPTIKIQIMGHTDNRGAVLLNKKVSTNRAVAIQNLLISKGIAQERIKAIGFGPERPIADNNTELGRSKNRRTEFEIGF